MCQGGRGQLLSGLPAPLSVPSSSSAIIPIVHLPGLRLPQVIQGCGVEPSLDWLCVWYWVSFKDEKQFVLV